jgi:hypothetical protein
LPQISGNQIGKLFRKCFVLVHNKKISFFIHGLFTKYIKIIHKKCPNRKKTPSNTIF